MMKSHDDSLGPCSMVAARGLSFCSAISPNMDPAPAWSQMLKRLLAELLRVRKLYDYIDYVRPAPKVTTVSPRHESCKQERNDPM